jgi:hypothetical protein
LCDSGIDIFLRLVQRVHVDSRLRIVGIVEDKTFTPIRPEIMEPVVLAFPVLVSKHLCKIEYNF